MMRGRLPASLMLLGGLSIAARPVPATAGDGEGAQEFWPQWSRVEREYRSCRLTCVEVQYRDSGGHVPAWIQVTRARIDYPVEVWERWHVDVARIPDATRDLCAYGRPVPRTEILRDVADRFRPTISVYDGARELRVGPARAAVWSGSLHRGESGVMRLGAVNGMAPFLDQRWASERMKDFEVAARVRTDDGGVLWGLRSRGAGDRYLVRIHMSAGESSSILRFKASGASGDASDRWLRHMAEAVTGDAERFFAVLPDEHPNVEMRMVASAAGGGAHDGPVRDGAECEIVYGDGAVVARARMDRAPEPVGWLGAEFIDVRRLPAECGDDEGLIVDELTGETLIVGGARKGMGRGPNGASPEAPVGGRWPWRKACAVVLIAAGGLAILLTRRRP